MQRELQCRCEAVGRGGLQEENARCTVAEAGGPEGALEAFLEGELPPTSFAPKELRGWEGEWLQG